MPLVSSLPGQMLKDTQEENIFLTEYCMTKFINQTSTHVSPTNTKILLKDYLGKLKLPLNLKMNCLSEKPTINNATNLSRGITESLQSKRDKTKYETAIQTC